MQDAQAAVDAQADRGVLLGPVDNGVVGPEAEPVVGGQGGDVVGDEEEDAQEGEEKPDGPHVAPVHRQLHLGATGEKVFSRMRPPRAPPGSGTSTAPVQPCPPPVLTPGIPSPLLIQQQTRSRSLSSWKLPVGWQERLVSNHRPDKYTITEKGWKCLIL